MNRVLVLFIIAAIIITGFLAYNHLIKKQVYMPQDNKKAVIIISFRNFRDAEYFIPKEILEEAGVEIKTASNKIGLAIGSDGGEVNIDLLVSDINIGEFDAVVFIGGPGCLTSLDNEQSYNIAREAVSQNKLLASICISPVILAKAGVLEGKKATVWSSPMDKSAVKTLEEKGVLYQTEPVVVDGKIITANGPAAAKGFGQAIIEGLTKSY
ncbi:MAG: DJ-1/PfpI family protein [Candidatus Nealsonbacteria bacterium]